MSSPDQSATDPNIEEAAARPQPAARAAKAAPPSARREAPFDVNAFRRDHRIHVQDSSLFTSDHHLVLHPQELAPGNEAKLAGKLLKHYAIPHPHFLGVAGREDIAFQLASLLPVPIDAKTQFVQKMLDEIRKEQTTNEDEKLAKLAGRHQSPFDALIRAHLEKPETSPIFDAVVQQASQMYLLVNEALRTRGYNDEVAGYVRLHSTPDQVLSELSTKLDISPREFAEVARTGGYEGIAARLGVKPQVANEIREVVTLASANHFADNMIENWNIGRMMPGAENQDVKTKISNGLQSRIGHAIRDYRDKRHGVYDVPAPTKAVEDKIVAALRELPPELAEMLYVSGTEFAYTPYMDVSPIDPTTKALGYHRFIPFENGSAYGTRQIFVAGRTNEREFEEVLTHEAHHVMFPMRFAPEERKTIDGLIQQSSQRLNSERGLRQLTAAWKAADTDGQRAAVEAEIDEKFSRQGLSLKQALNGQSMQTLYWLVDEAWQSLDPNSSNRTRAYHGPESRVAELISRYAELKYVRLRDNPALLDFIAPELAEVYNNHYLPHIRTQLTEMKQDQQKLPEIWRNMAIPTDTISPAQLNTLVEGETQAAAAPLSGIPTQHVQDVKWLGADRELADAVVMKEDLGLAGRAREQFVARLAAETASTQEAFRS